MQCFSFLDGAEFLTSSLALPDLSLEEALRVVSFMKLTLARRDALLFRAGNPGSPFLVMVLDGDALVEGRLTAASEPIVLRTLTAGSLFGEMGASDSTSRLITVRATSEVCLATLHYADLSRITTTDPVLGCALLQATLAHVTRRLRSADTWIETLNQINRSLQEEWTAEIKSDRATVARLNVLMKLERKTGLRTYLVGDRIEVRQAA
ncbi:MAG: cyclic nucleotide-binding domain-containing protein [Ramlibacter sp.]|nr:cyclic nucleotide-binding domain-containing protein [Ramlibacter sp.]